MRLLDETARRLKAPPRTLVLTICVATWLVRGLFLGLPAPLSIDEVSALTASEYGTASTFITTADWAERWDITNQFRQWHILWIAPHAIWGYLFPSNGQMVYALTALMALVAMLALAGAARHLWGERGFLLALLFASVSPLFLNYTVRALGTMPAVMWLSLALFALTSPRCGLRGWIAGGLCFGLAFGASFGAGAAIVAIAGGLGVSLVRRLFDGKRTAREKRWACALYPAAGALAAVLPLLPVELGARYAGGEYSAFLLHHTMLVLGAWPGPYGLWLREMFELDPLLQVMLMVTVIYALRSPSLRLAQKILLAVGYLLVVGSVVVSTEKASARALVSLGLFSLIGAAVWMSARHESPASDAPRNDPGPGSPFDRLSLAVSVVVLVVLLTGWRNLSNMPRLPFPGWPLLVLGLVGLMLRVVPSYDAVVRRVAVLGCLLFAIGAAATFHAKTAHFRARAFAAQHPYLTEVTYQDLWTQHDMAQNLGRLGTRARAQVAVIGPPATLYPSSCYEEDPFKILVYRQALRDFGVDDALSAEDVFWASIFFESSRPVAGAPPPGTPEVPRAVRALDADGLPFAPRIHPYRGIELRFPARRNGERPDEVSVAVTVPAEAGKDAVFGFEYEAIAPYMAAGALLTLSAAQGDRELAASEVPIVGSPGRQADPSLSLHDLPPQKAEPFRVFECPIHPAAAEEEVRIVARLSRPPGSAIPLSLYVRRPYVGRP